MLLDSLIFAAGIVLLVGGAWLLVTGGSRIASLLGVAPVVVGLTVVAFGTSAPELFVSLVAALRGNADLMIGNVVGSNLANIGLILGIAALIMPVAVDRELPKLEVPLLLAGTALFSVLCWDQQLGRLDGGLLFLLFWVFMISCLRTATTRGQHVGLQPSPPLSRVGRDGMVVNSVLVFLGIGGLTGGGHLIVSSAVGIATRLGASEAFIGLTLVAIGTSLPELATTVLAALRRESGIALGNVIGSNLFNLLAVAGPVALIQPLNRIEPSLRTHQLPALILITLLLPVMIHRREVVGRIWGCTLLCTYAAVMAWWFLAGI